MRLTPAWIALLVAGSAVAQAPAPVLGRWLTEGDKSVVEIRRCGEALCGTIVEVLKPDRDAAKRPSVVGTQILSGFRPDGARWRGDIRDPRSGKTYKSFLEPAAGGRVLKVSGCVLMFCQDQSWRRATPRDGDSVR